MGATRRTWSEGVYFPSPQRLKFVPDRPAISVSNGNSEVSGKRYGLVGLLAAISQLASRMGDRGSRAYAPHTVILPGSGCENRKRDSTGGAWTKEL